MIRRLSIAAATVVAAATLTACSAVPDRDAIATVGDATLTQDDFDEIMSSPLAGQLFQIPEGTTRYPMDAARRMIGLWIQLEAVPDDFIPVASDEDLIEGFGEAFAAEEGAARDFLTAYGSAISAISNGTVDQAEAGRFAQEADATVSSRFGRWDGEQFSVVPLGQ